jgi:hypothetical protein
MNEPQVPFRELIQVKLDRLEEQNDQAIELCKSMLVEQKITNGRLRAAEVKIAVLQVGYGLGTVLLTAGAYWLFSKLP